MTSPPRAVALVQTHRRLGVTTAVYFLGRALAHLGVRVLVADGTMRHRHFLSLWAADHPDTLFRYIIPKPYEEPLSERMERGKRNGTGKVNLILLDIDAALIERFKEPDCGLDYGLILSSPAPNELRQAEDLALLVAGSRSPRDHVGLVLARLNPDETSTQPQISERRHIPIVGALPADFGLAAGAAYSTASAQIRWPGAPYLDAVHGLARLLMRRLTLEHRQVP